VLHVGLLLGLFFDLKCVGDISLRNVRLYGVISDKIGVFTDITVTSSNATLIYYMPSRVIVTFVSDKKAKLSMQRAVEVHGLSDVEAPVFSTQSAHRWWLGYQSYVPAALYPQKKFLVLISVKG
jgi:hypothetical protein